LLFFLPRDAEGAVHTRRLWNDLEKLHGWTQKHFDIPQEQTGIDRHSLRIRLRNWFEGNRLTAFEGELTGPISKRHFGVLRRLRETASQTRPVSIGHPQDSRKQLCRRAWFGSMGPKSLGLKELAEREGFEPSVQVLARTTV
jgi:hypothetical protein